MVKNQLLWKVGDEVDEVILIKQGEIYLTTTTTIKHEGDLEFKGQDSSDQEDEGGEGEHGDEEEDHLRALLLVTIGSQ